jgi:hypothetical protein
MAADVLSPSSTLERIDSRYINQLQKSSKKTANAPLESLQRDQDSVLFTGCLSSTYILKK